MKELNDRLGAIENEADRLVLEPRPLRRHYGSMVVC